MTTHGSSFDSGGAGCVGTVEDYLKVITVLINKGVGANGARILEEATVEEMFRDQIADIPSGKPLDRMIEAATPTFTYEIQMMPGIDKGWVGLTSACSGLLLTNLACRVSPSKSLRTPFLLGALLALAGGPVCPSESAPRSAVARRHSLILCFPQSLLGC